MSSNPLKKAEQAVKDFMSKSGQHDTTVSEEMNPAVTHETRIKTEHEKVQQAIDKEIHQDHYHTSIQPIKQDVTLPEQIHTNTLPVEQRNFEHDDASQIKARLATEAANFKDEQTMVKGEAMSSALPVMAGEHIHHHVHEKIQPVLEKKVVEPHVIHTTVPIHEVHHNASQIHSTTALPTISLEEFQQQGGNLAGRAERIDGFKGEPREAISARMAGVTASGNLRDEVSGARGETSSSVDFERHVPQSSSSTTATAPSTLRSGKTTSSAPMDAMKQRSGITASSPLDNEVKSRGSTSSSSADRESFGKRLLDKFNTKTDADRDGKAGFMD